MNPAHFTSEPQVPGDLKSTTPNLAAWAVKISAVLMMLFALSLCIFAFLLVSEIGSVVWPLAIGSAVAMLMAARLFSLRRWAAIALPALFWYFAIPNIVAFDMWQWSIGMAVAAVLFTLTVIAGRRSLRSGF